MSDESCTPSNLEKCLLQQMSYIIYITYLKNNKFNNLHKLHNYT